MVNIYNTVNHIERETTRWCLKPGEISGRPAFGLRGAQPFGDQSPTSKHKSKMKKQKIPCGTKSGGKFILDKWGPELPQSICSTLDETYRSENACSTISFLRVYLCTHKTRELLRTDPRLFVKFASATRHEEGREILSVQNSEKNGCLQEYFCRFGWILDFSWKNVWNGYNLWFKSCSLTFHNPYQTSGPFLRA